MSLCVLGKCRFDTHGCIGNRLTKRVGAARARFSHAAASLGNAAERLEK
ncbi:MAG: hypothetical protein ACYYK0_07380 [Candidatus Eutrophobiaceae bacterium]